MPLASAQCVHPVLLHSDPVPLCCPVPEEVIHKGAGPVAVRVPIVSISSKCRVQPVVLPKIFPPAVRQHCRHRAVGGLAGPRVNVEVSRTNDEVSGRLGDCISKFLCLNLPVVGVVVECTS